MLKAKGVGYDELARINGKLAQVVRISGDDVTLQVFEGAGGIPTNAEVTFLGKAPTLKVSEQLAGRFFNAYGEPIDGGPAIEGKEVEIGGPSVNPVRRKQPSELIATGIAGIDLNNTLVSGQKIPFFADPDQPFNEVMAMVAMRAKADKIILGGMGMTNDDYYFFRNTFSNAGALDRIISFINTTEDPAVERLLVPDMALAAAEYFAVEKHETVLVLLTDMTSYADSLSIVSNRMDQIPSKDSMPGSLYSDLAKIYEKAVQFPESVGGGSITIIAVTTLSGGDITHAVPDNTGYITEGQLYLRRDSDVGKVMELSAKSAKITGTVPAGKVFVDGYGVGDVGAVVLRDRQHLAQDGMIVVVVSMSGEDGQVISGPDIITRGFVYVKESEALMEELRRVAVEALTRCADRNIRDWAAIKGEIKGELSNFLYKKTKRNPMILPVIMEV